MFLVLINSAIIVENKSIIASKCNPNESQFYNNFNPSLINPTLVLMNQILVNQLVNYFKQLVNEYVFKPVKLRNHRLK